MTQLIDREKVDQIGKAATDALHVAVGFGVLGFQKLQVRRREVQRAVENQFGAGTNDLHKLADVVRAQARTVDTQVQKVEPKIAAAFDRVEARLPEPVGSVVHQTRTVAEAVRDQARKRLHAEPAAAAPSTRTEPEAEPEPADQTASPNA